MTYQQKNNVMHIVQTVLISIGSAAATGCFIFMWNLNAFVAKQNELNSQFDKKFDDYKTTNDVKVNLLSAQEQNHETRISIIESQTKSK